MDLIVLAKEPIPGRVKTRLCPPCSPAEAAAVAEASLADTLDAACSSGADRVALALDGHPGNWCPSHVDVVDQGTGGLPERLTRAWSATSGPAVQIGMDTPQLTPSDLDAAMSTLLEDGVDAVLGPASDGGWWAIGLRKPHHLAFAGLPTSTPDTGDRQAERLAELGLRARPLGEQRDVDTWPDALAVAERCPGTRFARAVRQVEGRMRGRASGADAAGARRA